MGKYRPIECDQPQVLDPRLCQQQAVEGIASRRLGGKLGEDVARRHVHELEGEGFAGSIEIAEIGRQCKFADPMFDSDLPQARNAAET